MREIIHVNHDDCHVGKIMRINKRIGVVTKRISVDVTHSVRTHGDDKINCEIEVDFSKSAVEAALKESGVELGKSISVSVSYKDKEAFKFQFFGDTKWDSINKTWTIKELKREHFDNLIWQHINGKKHIVWSWHNAPYLRGGI